MDQETLTDDTDSKRGGTGAIPKRNKTSNHTIQDECIARRNELDERNEVDVRQRLNCANNGRCRDDQVLDHIAITPNSVGDSGIFIDEITESVGSFQSPPVHRNGSVYLNNIEQTLSNPAYSTHRRQDGGREDRVGTDAGFCHHGNLIGGKILGGFRKDSTRNGDKVGLIGGYRFQRYGSVGRDEVRRGLTKGEGSRNADRGETFKTEPRKEYDGRIWEEDRVSGVGDGDRDEDGDEVQRTLGTETPGHDDGSTLSEDGSIGTGHVNRSNSRESLARRVKTPSMSERGGRWPPFLWIMFKFLGMFWASPVIEERYCHQCYRKRIEEVNGVFHSPTREQKHVTSRHLSYLNTPEIGINDKFHVDDDHHRLLYYHQERGNALESSESNALLSGNIQGDHRIVSDGGYSVNEDDGEENDVEAEKGDERCRVCDALWWTGQGQYLRYTDKSIGLKPWNHRGSGMLSLVFLITYISLILYDAGYYANIYWGRKEDLIRYISYMSYLVFTGMIPTICLLGLLRNAATRPSQVFTQWPRALDIRYVVRRLQYLDVAEHGLPCKPFLVACTVCPLLIAFYRFMFYVTLVYSSSLRLHSYLACITTAIGLMLYGVFSYFIYLMRISFNPHLKLDINFIWHHVGQLDVCRAKMSSTVQDFLNLRQLANGWMVMVIGITTWAVATQVTWNYLLFSGIFLDRDGSFSKHSWTVQMYINGLMTMENLMFFILPCYAVGGFNINIVWIRFRYRLLELRRARHERFWYRLMQFLKEQDLVDNSMRVTMLFTLISLFVALQFGEQNIYYYYNNITARHVVTPLPLLHYLSIDSTQTESVGLNSAPVLLP